MSDRMTRDEAMRYFGVDEDELERIAVAYDLDADVDDEGRILDLEAAGSKEALFTEHERKVGHRPDDPDKAREAKDKAQQDEEDVRRRRSDRRAELEARVHARGSLTEG